MSCPLTIPQAVDARQQLLLQLQKAIWFEEADMGNIQWYNPQKKVLEIVSQVGFSKDFLEHFKEVKAFDTSVCGRALGMQSPVVVGDVNLDEGFAPHRAIAWAAGFRSVKSVPLITPDNVFRGMVSFHCRQPRWSWNITNPQEIYLLAEILCQSKSLQLMAEPDHSVMIDQPLL